MKKDNFITGAIISTICIVLSKILGIIYVIPFNRIIGPEGGALYSYSYNIYVLFLQLSTVGIPLAISKIVSEYNALEYHDAKRRTYKQAIIVTTIMALLSTLLLLVFANDIAYLIKGDIEGGNTLEDIAFVIRISSSAIFFVTMLSNIRGYLQGQKFIKDSSISQVIEQFVRVVIIVFGSYICMKIFGTKEAVAIAIFGATVGAVIALIYLVIKGRKELKLKDNNYTIKEEEKKLTNKILVKNLIKITIPFIILSVIVQLYITVDNFTLVKALVNHIGMDPNSAEYILSCIATWGAKLNMIVTSISSGIVVSLLPSVTKDFAKKNFKALEEKTTKTIQIILIFVIPMVVGLNILASPIWNVFYGNNQLGIEVFSFSIYIALFSGLFMNVNVMMQSTNRYKTVYISLVSGILFKIVMNVPFIILMNKIGLPAYYGSIISTISGYMISIIISLIDLKKAFKINYKDTIKILFISSFATVVMALILNILKLIIPINNLNKINSIMVICIYAITGLIVYGIIIMKSKTFHKTFQKEINTIKNKLKKRR